jgi:hypothetical protein
VEEAFEARLAAPAISQVEGQPRAALVTGTGASPKRSRAQAIDKSLLTVPVPRRVRDREHVKSVAKQPCLICGRRPADARHLRFAQSRALSRKVSDEFTVPLLQCPFVARPLKA